MLINSGLSKLPFYLNSVHETLVRCLEEKLTQTNPEGWRSGQHEQEGAQEDLKTILPMNPQLNISRKWHRCIQNLTRKQSCKTWALSDEFIFLGLLREDDRQDYPPFWWSTDSRINNTGSWKPLPVNRLGFLLKKEESKAVCRSWYCFSWSFSQVEIHAQLMELQTLLC